MSTIQEYSLDSFKTVGNWKGKLPNEPPESLTMGMISNSLPEEAENKRYYVSDTELIERRFLKDATESFERTVDPFAESKLYTTCMDVVYDIAGLKEINDKLVQKHFLEGTVVNDIPLAEILSAKNSKKLPKIDEKGTDSYKINIISEHTGIPIVVEEISSFWDTKWVNTVETTTKILWIREVADGWLCVYKTKEELETDEIWTTPFTKERNASVGKTTTIRKKVSEIKEEIEKIKINITVEKKKNELVDLYSKWVIFPERFLSHN